MKKIISVFLVNDISLKMIKQRIFVILILGLVSSTLATSAETKLSIMKGGSVGSNSKAKNQAGDNDWQKLTLRQKIGQTMLMLPNRKSELELGAGSLKGFFERYPVSGFFMGWKLFDGVKESDQKACVLKNVVEYQAASNLPLIFQQDYETGVNLPDMTPFPSEMAVGAAHSPVLSYQYGKAVALESRSVGVQWVLHPVADLNLNARNPITNIRSISDNPELAIQLLTQQILGLQDNGVAATIKHFPGDGVDYRDQHLMTTCNSLTWDQWQEKHGKVFQALIDAGVDVIMPGHITLPAFQKQKLNGFLPPATLSKELLTDLLKGKMGFKGVIVSDAMVMGGFRGWYPTALEGEIQSFLAGTDVLLWPSYEYMDEMERRILKGEIPMQRLDDAVSRIWSLKKKLNLFDPNRQLIRPISEMEKVESSNVSLNLSEHALTLVRDRNKSLPLDLKKDKKILLVGVAPISRKGGQGGLDRMNQFKTLLEKRGFQVDYQHDILYETQAWTENLTNHYDRIIFAAIRKPHQPYGTIDFYDDEAQTVWAINSMPKEKIIVISFGSPYIGEQYFERVNTYINAYSNDQLTYSAVVKALLGEIPFQGISPVKLSENVTLP